MQLSSSLTLAMSYVYTIASRVLCISLFNSGYGTRASKGGVQQLDWLIRLPTSSFLGPNAQNANLDGVSSLFWVS